MITALVPWYGSNRMLAEEVGKKLQGCHWIGIPFAGSMTEVRHMTARTILVNDLHSDVINLAQVLADPIKGEEVQKRLELQLFHPQVLKEAQNICISKESGMLPDISDIDAAVAYFTVAWMSRSGVAGTDSEFKSGLALRWTAKGGDSAVRFANAVDGISEWQKTMRRCSFSCLDVFKFLEKVKDEEKHGLYCDPPFPDGPGDSYRHKFTEFQHRMLASFLQNRFNKLKIVCRFYDSPLVQKLYAASEWAWHRFDGRDQANAKKPEVLLTRNIN